MSTDQNTDKESTTPPTPPRKPSFVAGELHDPSISEQQIEGFSRLNFLRVLRQAIRGGGKSPK